MKENYIKKSFLFIFFTATVAFSQSTQTFNVNGSFTVPAGITSMQVECWGGGGKGGARTTNGQGGGAGGGAYSKSLLAVTSGTTYTVTVGAGAISTSAGGDSWFINNTTVMAKGGNSVLDNTTTGATGGLASASIGTVKFNGGNGANSAATYGGGGGSSAGTAANGTTAINNIGAIAPAGGANGGAGRNATEGTGTIGAAPGGGGGGAFRTTANQVGGNGANGRVIITWGPEVNIQGNTVSIVDGDTTPAVGDFTDFGSTSVLSGFIIKTFVIQNTGINDLTIGAITFTGANAADFKTITLPSATIIAGGSSSFDVRFIPSATGLRTATINIANNDANENPYDFSIQGTGVASTMNVLGGIASNVVIPDGLTSTLVANGTDFQSTNVASPIYRTYTIANLGASALNLTGTPLVVISGSTDFTVFTPPTTPVPVTGTRTFIIQFNPIITGIKTADITIANSDAGVGKNPYTFRITGEAVQKFIDTDGDGIFDHIDADDDNDGIPDVKEQSFSSGNSVPATTDLILLNETFGTSITRARINVNIPTATTDYCYEDGTTAQAADECDATYDLNDGQYTVSNTAQIAGWAAAYWYTGLDHTTGDTDGRMGLFNATPSITEEFYRTVVQGVILGAPVEYSFWVLNLDRSDAPGIATRPRPDITVQFRDLNTNVIAGSTINTGAILPTAVTNVNGDWYQFTTTFTPTTTNGFSIVFKNNQIGGGGNDLAIDDIVVKQKLTDADGDGAGDVFDLDCDNDGIGDIIEDGWVALGNGKDTMDFTNPAKWVDANANGWNDTTEAYYVSGNQKDLDGDGVPNYVDLDSDNDADFDVDEAGLLNGDGDVNCDGAGEGTDADKDGILSSFDTFNGFANGVKALPQNTLGSGNPDYLKLISKAAGVTDISRRLYASLDANSDGIIDGTVDADKDGVRDAFDTNNNYFGSPRDLNRKLLLDFDGRNDYGQDAAILGGLANASLMAWVDLNSAFSTDGVIIGQDKFQIKVNAARNIQVIANGAILTYSTVALNTSQWYNIGAVYGGGLLKL
jgi:hypothetical protein